MKARAWFSNGRVLQILLLGLAAAAILPATPQMWRGLQAAELRPPAPDWPLFAALAPQIKIHIVSAVTALAIGIVIWLLPKGRGPHKALGWAWVAAMAVTAVSSLFITGMNGGFYSFIHLLSGWTMIALPMAVFAIRNRNVLAHRRFMTGIFVGGLIIAGSFSFIPGRFMFEFLFG